MNKSEIVRKDTDLNIRNLIISGKTLLLVVSIISLFFIISFLFLSYEAISLKLNYTGFEDATSQEISRIIKGKPLYADASIEYVPLLYSSIYFYTVAPIFELFGRNLIPARIISLLSAFLSVSLLYFFIKQLILGKKFLRIKITAFLVAAGIFLSSHKLIGLNLVTGKVDSLFLFLLSLTSYLLFMTLKNKSKSIPALAILSGCLFFTKQTGLLLSISIAIILFVAGKKKSALIYSVIFSVLTCILLFYFEFKENGNFLLYTISVPRTHPVLLKSIIPEFISVFSPFLAIVLLNMISRIRFNSLPKPDFIFILKKLIIRRTNNLFVVSMSLVFLIISFLGRAKAGALGNSWMFLIYAVSLIIGSILAKNLILFEKKRSRSGAAIHVIILLLVIFQFFTLGYNPFEEHQDIVELREKEEKYISLLCKLDQPVLIPDSPYYPEMFCNTRSGYLAQAAQDIMGHGEQFEKFYDSVVRSYKNKEFKTIILFEVASAVQIKMGLDMLSIQIEREKSPTKKNNLLIFKKALELNVLTLNEYRRMGEKDMTQNEREFMKLNPRLVMLKAK